MEEGKEDNKQKTKYIHEVRMDGNDEFSQRFNDCSDLFEKANDPELTEQERKEAGDLFVQKRICLEMGIG